MELLRAALAAYIPQNEQEARDKEVMLEALDTQPTPLTRDNPFLHFSASAWIVNPDRTKVLMVWHNIYRTWAWTGGHADGECDLLAVALREAREETGIEDIRPVTPEIYSLEILPVQAHVKRGKFVSAHLHLNVTYLLTADDAQPLRPKPDENSDVAWLPLGEAAENKEEPFMAVIYRKLNAGLSRFTEYDPSPILAKLETMADPAYRDFTDGLTPDSGEMLGVRLPQLRALAKEICKGDWRGFLSVSRGHTLFEMRMLHGIVLGVAKCPIGERIEYIDAFLPFVKNWAVCDTLCTSLKPKAGDQDTLYGFACQCAESSEEFRKRFGLVILMGRVYARPPYLERTLEIYRGFSHPGYYARMGAAWGLATLCIHARDSVLDILRGGTLDDFTHNKAIQKIQESYRISPEDKQLARALRRKAARK